MYAMLKTVEGLYWDQIGEDVSNVVCRYDLGMFKLFRIQGFMNKRSRFVISAGSASYLASGEILSLDT